MITYLALVVLLYLLSLPIPRAKLVVKWYDGWVGFFWDRKQKQLYVFLVPFIGLCIECCNHDGARLTIGQENRDFLTDNKTLVMDCPKCGKHKVVRVDKNYNEI